MNKNSKKKIIKTNKNSKNNIKPIKNKNNREKAMPIVPGINTPVTSDSMMLDVIIECIDVLLNVCGLYGFDKKNFAAKGLQDHHLVCVRRLDGNWMKFYKYKLASFYAYEMGQEMPKAIVELYDIDTQPVLFGGKLQMWQKGLSRKVSKSFYNSFLYALLQSKKAFPRPDQNMVEQAKRDTYDKLTKKIPKELWNDSVFTWGELDEYENEVGVELNDNIYTEQSFNKSKIERIKEELRRTTKEIFQGKVYSITDKMKPLFPSTSANYNRSRSKGGAVGAILNNSELMKGLKTQDDLIKFESKLVSSRSNEDKIGLASLGVRNEQYIEVVNDELLCESYNELYARAGKLALKEEPLVELVGLEEALKVRVISKGPPLTYFVLKPLQKFMWKTLREHESGCFKLIGEEITAKHIALQVGKLRDNERILSGDYSDATNCLSSWVCDTIIEQLIEILGLDDSEAELLKRSLTGHKIMDPDSREEVGAKQTNGQLMGSIMSFPFLCIANATLCRWVREVSCNRKLSLGTANITINGDDCVFRCNRFGKKFWEKIGERMGLSPSIGKVYFSREFLNMNSTLYTVLNEEDRISMIFYSDISADNQRRVLDAVEEHKVEIWKGFVGDNSLPVSHVKYANLGLARGIKRSKTNDAKEVAITDWGLYNSIGKNAEHMLNTCPSYCQRNIYNYYINHNWEKLSKARVPWFLPEHLGGLGLPIRPDLDKFFTPSKKDLRIAAVIQKYYQIPTRGKEGVNWKTWEYAQKRLPLKGKGRTQQSMLLQHETFAHKSAYDNIVETNDVLGKLCVESLFRVDNIQEIYNDNNRGSKTLAKLEEVWSTAMKSEYMESIQTYELHALPKVGAKYKFYYLMKEPGSRIPTVNNEDQSRLYNLHNSQTNKNSNKNQQIPPKLLYNNEEDFGSTSEEDLWQ